MQILFQGQVEATPTAATILIEGVQVFSGQVGAGQPLNTAIEYANIASAGGAVSISVTSGILNVGQVWKDPNPLNEWSNAVTYAVGDQVTYQGNEYENTYGTLPANASPPGTNLAWQLISVTIDARTNILINGQAPEWPATPVTPMPGGTAQNPDWAGWAFEVSAGETITFTV
jgi:hypothetical protein